MEIKIESTTVNSSILKESSSGVYSVMAVYQDGSRNILVQFDDIRPAISHVLELADSNSGFKQGEQLLAVLNDNGSIFEIDRNGIVESDKSNANGYELRVIRDFMQEDEPETKRMSISFDLEVPITWSEEGTENIIRRALKAEKLSVDSYMEVHTQE